MEKKVGRSVPNDRPYTEAAAQKCFGDEFMMPWTLYTSPVTIHHRELILVIIDVLPHTDYDLILG